MGGRLVLPQQLRPRPDPVPAERGQDHRGGVAVRRQPGTGRRTPRPDAGGQFGDQVGRYPHVDPGGRQAGEHPGPLEGRHRDGTGNAAAVPEHDLLQIASRGMVVIGLAVAQPGRGRSRRGADGTGADRAQPCPGGTGTGHLQAVQELDLGQREVGLDGAGHLTQKPVEIGEEVEAHALLAQGQ